MRFRRLTIPPLRLAGSLSAMVDVGKPSETGARGGRQPILFMQFSGAPPGLKP